MTSVEIGSDKAAPPWCRRFVCGLLASCTIAAMSLVSSPAVAMSSSPFQSMDLEVGAMVGGNWNLLNQPSDPEGSHTFLWGSAFSGFGTVIGATTKLEIAEFEDAAIGVSADLLYGYHRGAGFAEHRDGGRIDVLLTTDVVRVPVMLRFGNSGDGSGMTLGAGLEPIFGVMSSATVETTNVDGNLDPVHTTPATSVAGILALGLDWQASDWVVPIEARLAWNPFVGSSTEERYQNFESPDEPGEYRVMFDWQVMVTAGMRFKVEDLFSN